MTKPWLPPIALLGLLSAFVIHPLQTRAQVPIPADELTVTRTVPVSFINRAPGGGTSSTVSLMIMPKPTLPVITSLEPATIFRPADGYVTFRIRGSGFNETSKVLVSGEQQEYYTQVVSATEISQGLASGYFQDISQLAISVRNPGPGGGTSSTVNLVVRDPSVVEFQSEQLAVHEGTGRTPNTTRIRVIRTGDLSAAITVPYSVGGTAVPGQDIGILSGSVFFSAGDSAVLLITSVTRNDTPEADRTVILELQEADGYQLGPQRRFVLTIIDDDPLARNVELVGAQLLREGVSGAQAAADLSIQWTEPPAGVTPPASVTVHYTVEGTATPGVDYVALPGTITVPFGQTVTPLAVTVLSDQETDPDETIILRLTPHTDYTLPRFRGGSFYLSIQDAAPVATPVPRLLAISPQQVVASAANVSIQLLGENFMPPNGPEGSTVLWDGAPRAASYVSPTELTVTVTPEDMLLPGPRTIAVRNGGADETSEPLPFTIAVAPTTLDPVPIVLFRVTEVEVEERDAPRTLSFNLGRRTPDGQHATQGTIRVGFNVSGTATIGADYDLVPSPASSSAIEIRDTNSEAQLFVLLRQDEEQEPTETIEIRLEDGEGYVLDPASRVLVVSILDDDDPDNLPPDEPIPVVSLDPVVPTVREADAPRTITLRIRRSVAGQPATGRQIAIPISVSGSATQGEDYTLQVPGENGRISSQGPAILAFGQSQNEIYLTVLRDDVQEDTESIVIRLEDGPGFTPDPTRREVQLDIIDDDNQASASAPPVLTRVVPRAAVRADGRLSIELEGSGFVAGSVARWAGTALETALSNPERLQATVPERLLETTGTTLIDVANADGQTSNAVPFEVVNPEPRLTGVQPASAVAGSSEVEVTLSGQRFLRAGGPDQPGSSVLWNGEERRITFVRPTELRLHLEAADLAAPGTATVTVANPAPGGGTSAPATFTIEPTPVANPVPVLMAIEPDSARRGRAITLTLRGADFVQGARVLWGGTPVETLFVSSGELQARIPPQLVAGTRDQSAAISVENPPPAGGVSGALRFRLVRPGG